MCVCVTCGLCGRVFVSSALVEKSEPKPYTVMPNTSLNHLKKENEKLKDEIADLQQLLERHDESSASNDSHICSLDAETSTSLEFYGKSYDDLKKSQAVTDRRLNELWSRLDALATRVEEMSNTLEKFQHYSYQYNINITGLPETNTQESASETSAMCLNLFKAAGVDISDQDIAHRISTRIATSGPRPVICKFTRRITKEQVMKKRKDACKIVFFHTHLFHLYLGRRASLLTPRLWLIIYSQTVFQEIFSVALL